MALAIFDDYFQQVLEQMQAIETRNMKAKEKLKHYIAYFLELLSEHKEYIIMHLRDLKIRKKA